jgi:hypothetical protein
MKKYSIIFLIATISTGTVNSQDFKADIATAKTAYAAGKLEDTHFALQQALSEIDMIIGKEVLKLLPSKMDTAAANMKQDRVSSNVGFAGATVYRSYGKDKAVIEIISNSPLIASLNALMNMPLMGGIMTDQNNKTVKVQGYKARLERQTGETEDKFNYVLQLPYNSALLTLTVKNCTDNEILKMADTLPIDNIAKLIQ